MPGSNTTVSFAEGSLSAHSSSNHLDGNVAVVVTAPPPPRQHQQQQQPLFVRRDGHATATMTAQQQQQRPPPSSAAAAPVHDNSNSNNGGGDVSRGTLPPTQYHHDHHHHHRSSSSGSHHGALRNNNSNNNNRSGAGHGNGGLAPRRDTHANNGTAAAGAATTRQAARRTTAPHATNGAAAAPAARRRDAARHGVVATTTTATTATRQPAQDVVAVSGVLSPSARQLVQLRRARRPHVTMSTPPLLLQAPIYDRAAWLRRLGDVAQPRLDDVRRIERPRSRRAATATATTHASDHGSTTRRVCRPNYRVSALALAAAASLSSKAASTTRAGAAAAAAVDDDDVSTASTTAAQLLVYGSNGPHGDVAAAAYDQNDVDVLARGNAVRGRHATPSSPSPRVAGSDEHDGDNNSGGCTRLLDCLWAAVDRWLCVRRHIAAQTRLLFVEEWYQHRLPRRFCCEAFFGRDGAVRKAMCTMCILDTLTLGLPCGCFYPGVGTLLYGWRLRYLVRSRYRIDATGRDDLLAMCCCPALAVEQQAYEMAKHGLLQYTTRGAQASSAWRESDDAMMAPVEMRSMS